MNSLYAEINESLDLFKVLTLNKVQSFFLNMHLRSCHKNTSISSTPFPQCHLLPDKYHY